jgi:hypothetical protein
MNPYVMVGTGIGTSQAASLTSRLTDWHDAMVAHERALRAGRNTVVCDDECPHAEARALWAEAIATFGARAQDLAFLRSRATAATQPAPRRTTPRGARAEAADHTPRVQPQFGRDAEDVPHHSSLIGPAKSQPNPAKI